MRFSYAIIPLVLMCLDLSAQSPIRSNTGFGTSSIARNDDASAGPVPLGFTVNFFGQQRTSVYVNNNGNVTFDGALASYTPFGLTGVSREIIAAFFADVDTRGTASSVVTYGTDTVGGRQAFGVNYLNVGYYAQQTDKLNRFQLVLINRSDTGVGNFDIELNYERIAWETGDLSGGTAGLGGTSGAVGWSNGLAGAANRSFQLPGSLTPGSFLDSNSNGLKFRSIGTTQPGRLLFEVRTGVIISVVVSPNTVSLSSGQTQQFTATVTGATNNAVTWSISPQLGSISSTGLYTAPASIAATQNVSIIATSAADTGRTGTATVSLTSSCNYSISSPSLSFDSNGGNGSFNVSTGTGCAWQAVSNNAFVMITSGASGNGNGTVSYSVAANTGGNPRSAAITVANQTHIVTQAGRGCLAGLTPTRASVPSTGGIGAVVLAMSSPDCAWLASSNVPWATVNPQGGVGSATINYTYSTNGTVNGRSGTLNFGGIPFTLTQGGTDCSGVSLSEAQQSYPASGGTGSVLVAIPTGCPYTALATGGFISITSGGAGNGSQLINFSVQSNAGNTFRTGTITVGAQTLTITQSGNSTPTVTCTVSDVSSPTRVRSFGRTELIAALEILCSGRSGGNIYSGDLILTTAGNITNRITQTASDLTDAFLTVDGGGTVPGKVDGANTLRFRRIPISTGEPTVSRRFTIQNVRVDVSNLGSDSGTTGLPISATVTISAPVLVPVLSGTRTVAQSRSPLSVLLGTQRDATTGKIVPVVVQEGFADVLKSKEGEGGPGADTPTRVRLKISNVPATVSVFAPVQSDTSRARQMSADTNGVGGTAVAGFARAGGTYAQITNFANGTGYVTYEVTAVDPLAIESQTFGLLVENATATQLSAMRFEAALGPIADVVVASATAPVPRFADAGRPLAQANLRVTSRVQTAGSRPLLVRAPVGLGNSATFTYDLKNDSDQRADNVVMRNAVPQGMSNPSCTISQGTCAADAEGNVRFNVGSLPAGAQATGTTTATVGGVSNCPNCLGNGSSLQNSVSASSDLTDPDLNNNTSETIVDVVSACTFNLSRSVITAAPTGATIRVDVATGPACDWSVANPVAGVEVSPAGPYRGNVTLTLNISPNTTILQKSGVITIAGQSLRLVQAAQSCLATLTMNSTTLAPQAANYTAQLSINAGCAWEAVSGPDWLRVTSAVTGTGNASINFSAQENPSIIVRTAFIEIAGTTLQLIQPSAAATGVGCTYNVSPPGLNLSGAGGSGTITVTTQSNCLWTASANVSWASIASGISGTGSGTVTVNSVTNPATARNGTLTVAGQTVQIAQGINTPSAPLRFVALNPCRLMETRAEYNFEGRTGAFGPPFMRAGETRTLSAANSNVCVVPATAKAYVFNVTLVPRGGVDFVTIYPGGESRPDFWSIRSPDGQVVANSAIVRSGNGEIQVFTSNDTDIIIDITGYMTDNAAVSNLVYYPLTPCRVIETRIDYRTPAGPFGPPTMNPRETRRFRFPAGPYCTVPNGASAYSVTITAVPPAALAFMTAWPSGGSQPNVSQINSPAGRVLANSVIVPASTDGSIDVFAFDRTDFIVDINGYFAPDDGANGLFYFPVTQCRISDSRNAASTFGGPIFADDSVRSIPVPASSCSGVPGNARGYSINATALPGGSPMPFLTLYPSGQARPNASILNAFQGQIVTNSAIIPAGPSGSIDVYAFRQTHIVLDLSGYFGR